MTSDVRKAKGQICFVLTKLLHDFCISVFLELSTLGISFSFKILLYKSFLQDFLTASKYCPVKCILALNQFRNHQGEIIDFYIVQLKSFLLWDKDRTAMYSWLWKIQACLIPARIIVSGCLCIFLEQRYMFDEPIPSSKNKLHKPVEV